MSDCLTIVVELPVPLSAVARLLEVVASQWPNAVVNLSGPRGWTITVGGPEYLDEPNEDRPPR